MTDPCPDGEHDWQHDGVNLWRCARCHWTAWPMDEPEDPDEPPPLGSAPASTK